MTEQIDDNITIDDSSLSLGEQLKSAREEKKLSVTEVASQLRFTQETIQNLESENWALLHGRAYARGYFLSYVKFLGLSESDMVEAFNVAYVVNESAPPRIYQSPSSDFPWFKVILIVIVLGITYVGYEQWQASQASLSKDELPSPSSQVLIPQNPSMMSNEVDAVIERENTELDLIEEPLVTDPEHNTELQ
jgi:cytoskeleton protein RodZ